MSDPDNVEPANVEPANVEPANVEPELAAIEAALRGLSPADIEERVPPPELWAEIESSLNAVASAAPIVLGTNVVPLHKPARSPAAVFAVAAAVVAVVGGGVALIASRSGSNDTVRAVATLAFDEGFDPLGVEASASVELVEVDDHFELRVAEADLPVNLAEAADLELWLIALDASGTPIDVAPVALVDAETPGSYRIPATIDPAVNTIVDISIEPRDGDKQHSGRSILRGPLNFD